MTKNLSVICLRFSSRDEKPSSNVALIDPSLVGSVPEQIQRPFTVGPPLNVGVVCSNNLLIYLDLSPVKSNLTPGGNRH